MPDQHIRSAVLKLLKPLVRLLIRSGITYSAFSDLARQAYVDMASEEFTIAGKKQSISRISVLTGINRKDISRLQKSPHPVSDSIERKQNRAFRDSGRQRA